MRKLVTTIIAAIGLIGFATAAQAECAGHLQSASAETGTVATDSTTTTKPILQEQSGG
jgi:hypothetical protein